MSIYASWPAPHDHHPGPDAPLVYQGSHVIPTAGDPRGGWIDIASIPRHITGGDEDDGWLPFLRIGVNDGTVVLDRRGVELVHRSLTEWLAGLEAS